MEKIEYNDQEYHSSLSNRVFNRLQDDILNGKYKPGESLKEARLSEELGVSRTPVREAMRQLELEGLVKSIPNKGVVVKGISNQDIKDICTIRIMIEGLAARWAAEKITDVELEELAETLQLEQYYTGKNDISHLIKLDTKFHEILFKASKSLPLINILRNFHHYLQKAREGSLKHPERAKRMFEEHKAILNALNERDPVKAENCTVEHVRNATANLIREDD